MTDWQARVLDAVDAGDDATVGLLAELVRVPSVSGSAAENDLQARLATLLQAEGLEVDHWRIPLAETLAAPGFPGAEVPRTEAWGLVGRLAGRSQGPSLLLNAHVDVVPPGDPDAWTTDPFGGRVEGGTLYGRGACDMKGGLVAALAAVRALRRARVPLGGDVLVACVQGEEDGGLGTFAMLRRGWRADACVIPEPTGLDLPGPGWRACRSSARRGTAFAPAVPTPARCSDSCGRSCRDRTCASASSDGRTSARRRPAGPGLRPRPSGS
jgi:acetylornithine deacetylase